jgi:hypothetical protein
MTGLIREALRKRSLDFPAPSDASHEGEYEDDGPMRSANNIATLEEQIGALKSSDPHRATLVAALKRALAERTSGSVRKLLRR